MIEEKMIRRSDAMDAPILNFELDAAACKAAYAWHVGLMDRLEGVDKATGIQGYCVASGLREAFNALPIDQRNVFLDAVGAYLMTCHAIGRPTRNAYITPELLAVYASTPAKQKAWADTKPEEE